MEPLPVFQRNLKGARSGQAAIHPPLLCARHPGRDNYLSYFFFPGAVASGGQSLVLFRRMTSNTGVVILLGFCL